ncbi:glycosyltransferase family 2 protein [Pseudovibrio exalbescens]|uniref:glycosyltransferase family 2 protein n=1 Tax=Pseudovibrio exalbescens TaxID=197461 RepID=UPI002365E6FA|nr:glycosyltransferase family 2 protein [Pseudovibrio exalbescens]MDD7911505.1 glycosyltransferase family 2 protein [Pseudovibrio exalbescens]
MIEPPILSVLIPCRNRHHLLEELLLSIEQQKTKYKSLLEVIVIDDASDPPLCMDHIKYSFDVSIVRNDKCVGAPISRKKGLTISLGEIIHFHDSDDLLPDNWVEEIVKVFLTTPNLDMVITPRIKLTQDKEEVIRSEELAKLVHKPKLFTNVQRYMNIVGPLGGVSFRRRVVNNLSFHDVPASQDWLMYDEALTQSRKVEYLQTTHFIFRDLAIERISNSSERRLSGYRAAAKLRFKSWLLQYIAMQIYIAGAPRDFRKSKGNVLSGLIRAVLKSIIRIRSRI